MINQHLFHGLVFSALGVAVVGLLVELIALKIALRRQISVKPAIAAGLVVMGLSAILMSVAWGYLILTGPPFHQI